MTTRQKTAVRRLRRAAARAGTAGLLAMGWVGTAQAEARAFEIAPQPLATALRAFADQAQAHLLFSQQDVAALTSGGLSGRYEEDAALAGLLAGTGLVYERTASDVIVIRLRRDGEGAGDRQPAGAHGQGQRPLAPVGPAGQPRPGSDRSVDDAVLDQEVRLEEMVVTGSNIRGAGAPAAAVVTLDAGDIDASGFSTLDDVLNALPQNAPTLRLGASGATAPGLALPVGTAGGAGIDLRGLGPGSTLTLLNGKRMAPGGRGDFFDISMIPASAIERVETVLDGGSPIYGTDAVAGTVNIILKDDFEGAETRVRYGTAFDGDADEVRVGQLIGRNWASGNVTASYEFFSQDPLAIADRNFLGRDPAPPGDLTPRLERHSAFLAMRQDLGDSLQVTGEAFYSFRDQVTATPNLGVVSRPTLQESSFRVEQLSVSGGVDWHAGAGWLVSAGGVYNELDADTLSLRKDITDGMAGPDPSVTLSSFNNSKFIVGNVNADGPLFDLPAGTVKAAVGGDYRRQSFAVTNPGSVSFPAISAERDVWAAYGELSIPVVSPAMSVPGVYSLDVTVAGRFEHYSDFGSTANPRVGVEWRPVEGLTVKGSYGTSFRAPDFATQFVNDTAQLFDFGPFLDPALGVGSLLVLFANTAPALDELAPEKAETFSVGFDYAPAYLEGFTLSLNYFDIDFKDRIAGPGGPVDIIERELTAPGTFPPTIALFDPPAAVIQAALARADDVINFAPGSDFQDADVFLDITRTNIATQNVNGVDVFVSYAREVGPGTVSASLNLSFLLENQQTIIPGSEPVDVINRVFFPTDFRARGQVGWSGDGLAVNTFVNYADGYANDFVSERRRVGSFTTVDANVAYDFSALSGRWQGGSGLLLRLSVLNVFDQDPPLIFQSADEAAAGNFGFDFDTVNADALGRRVAIELVKRW